MLIKAGFIGYVVQLVDAFLEMIMLHVFHTQISLFNSGSHAVLNHLTISTVLCPHRSFSEGGLICTMGSRVTLCSQKLVPSKLLKSRLVGFRFIGSSRAYWKEEKRFDVYGLDCVRVGVKSEFTLVLNFAYHGGPGYIGEDSGDCGSSVVVVLKCQDPKWNLSEAKFQLAETKSRMKRRNMPLLSQFMLQSPLMSLLQSVGVLAVIFHLLVII